MKSDNPARRRRAGAQSTVAHLSDWLVFKTFWVKGVKWQKAVPSKGEGCQLAEGCPVKAKDKTKQNGAEGLL